MITPRPQALPEQGDLGSSIPCLGAFLLCSPALPCRHLPLRCKFHSKIHSPGTSYSLLPLPLGFLGSRGPILPFTCPKDCVFGACFSGAEKKGTLIPCASIPGHLVSHPLHHLAYPSGSFLSDLPSLPSGGPVPCSFVPVNTQITQIKLSFRVYLDC